jgi:hypothetical protein
MKKYPIIFLLIFSFLLISPEIAKASKGNLVNAFSKITSIAIKDPFYPDYPQRRILFPTINLPWWGTPGLSHYTLTSNDPRVGSKTVSFYSSGSILCPDGLEMGLPFGPVPNDGYSHIVCTLTKSNSFLFLFPRQPTSTAEATLDSQATITGDGNLNATVYVPLSWWQ